MFIDGFFLVIGYKFNLDIFKDYLDIDEVGYIIIEVGILCMKVFGVFVVGDVVDLYYC